MANLSSEKRQTMMQLLSKIKEANRDDDSVVASIAEIENELNSKKYGLVWEEHEEKVDIEMRKNVPVFVENEDREIATSEGPFNFILEGDNLHSLYLLEKTCKERVDCIYIDPPYNTGAKDWKYNNDYVDKKDTYRHSKWLSMMSARLRIAKNLLKEDGVLICAIDENELGTTLLLLDDIFGPSYKVDPITVIHNPRGIQGDNFSYINEYAIFVYKKGFKVIEDQAVKEDEIDWSPLRNWGTESERSDAANCFYPIYVKDGIIVGFGDDVTSDESFHPQQTEYDEETNTYSIYPIDVNGVERKWRYARQSVESISHLLRVKKTKTGYDIELGKDYAPYKTVWTDKKYDANEYGSQLVKSMVPNNDFDFPKSVYNVYECLRAVTLNKPNALIVDFFAGSGTTGHATLMLNNDIGGNRRFILCTNNDVGEKKEKEYKKKYGVIDETSEDWYEYCEQYGIASSVTYPRIRAAITGFTHNKDFKDVLLQQKITPSVIQKADKLMEKVNMIISDNKDKYDEVKSLVEDNTFKVIGVTKKGHTIAGIPANLKYYRTSYISKDEEFISESLLGHVSEMIQLEYGIKLDGKKYLMIMSDDEADELEKHWSEYAELQALFISKNVLLTAGQNQLLKNTNIYIIPDYYFNYELREVGETW